MNIRALAVPVLLAFCLFAVFGLFLPMGSMGMSAHCPYATGGTALCGLQLLHLEHWLSAFAVVLVEIVLLSAFLLAVIRLLDVGLREKQFERYRPKSRIPTRPSLMQELYSRGILNRKEPST